MMDNIVIGAPGVQERCKIEAVWGIYFGHITAAQSKVAEDIRAEGVKFSAGFQSGENGAGGSVLSNDVRIFSKIVFEISGRVVAAGGDDGVKILELLYYRDPVGEARFCLYYFFDQELREHGVL